MLRMLPIDSLVPADDNLRRRTGDVRDLAASITAVGVIEPLVVSPTDDDDRYVIVAGHRRHAAAQKAGLAEVPCTIRTLTDAERIEIMLVENLQRADLSAIEEASGYFRLVEHGLSQKELARRIGRSARHVASRLALLELPKAVQDALHAGSLTVGDGQALLALREHPEVIERLIADESSRGDLERSVIREQHRLEAARTAAERAENDAHDGERAPARTDERTDPYAAERAKAKVRNRASKARIEFASSLLTRRIPKTDVWAHVSSQVLADLSATHAKSACRILGIEAIEGSWGPDYRGAIEAYAARSTADRDRAVLAAALAIGEDHARDRDTDATATRHVEFLATFGFEREPTDDNRSV